MTYVQKRQPQLCDELIFKICSEYTHGKQLPWDWSWEKPRSLNKKESFRTVICFLCHYTTQLLCTGYLVLLTKLARAQSHHQHCLEETVIPHSQNYVFIYVSTLFLCQLLFENYAATKSYKHAALMHYFEICLKSETSPISSVSINLYR